MSKIKITTRTEAWVVEGDEVMVEGAFVFVHKHADEHSFASFAAIVPAVDLVSMVVIK